MAFRPGFSRDMSMRVMAATGYASLLFVMRQEWNYAEEDTRTPWYPDTARIGSEWLA